MDDKQLENLAIHAYHAYGQVTDFKNYQGLPMPAWEMLTDKIREAWKAATQYVYEVAASGIETPDHR